jgi:hypothetical protein
MIHKSPTAPLPMQAASDVTFPQVRSLLCVHGDCEQHKCRREDKPRRGDSKPDVVLRSGRRSTLGYSCFPRILTLYWLRFGVFSLAGAAGSRLRVNTPDSNWLSLDNHGFGVSCCSIKNKMFCAHVVAHEPWLTAVSCKAVGRRSQRTIKNSCVR